MAVSRERHQEVLTERERCSIHGEKPAEQCPAQAGGDLDVAEGGHSDVGIRQAKNVSDRL